MDRRQFLGTAGAVLASGAVATHTTAAQVPECADQPVRREPLYVQQQPYRIGYTTNTRGGWEGDPFKGMREGREVGFRYMEIFGTSFCRPDSLYYPDDAEGLMRRIFEIGVNFVSITGGSATGNTRFEDLDSRQAVVENHFAMARFSRCFGCQVQKRTRDAAGRAARRRTILRSWPAPSTRSASG
jgi:hypothetical protein